MRTPFRHRAFLVAFLISASIGGCGGCGADECAIPTGSYELFAHRTRANTFGDRPPCARELSGTMDLRGDGTALLRITELSLERVCPVVGLRSGGDEAPEACAPRVECPPCAGAEGCLDLAWFIPAPAPAPPELMTASSFRIGDGSAQNACHGSYRAALWRQGDVP